MKYPFTEAEFKQASDEWGCNCGPSALAFALQVPLDAARYAIPDFDKKRYTSPTMMKAALAELKHEYVAMRLPLRPKPKHRNDLEPLASDLLVSLVRVQWTGPWTDPGANPRWAYGHTHWICTWRRRRLDDLHPESMVFDCNGGVRSLVSWDDEIAPILAAAAPRRYGDWFPTHIWRLYPPR